MRCNHKYLDLHTRFTIQNAVGKARHPVPPNAWRKHNAKPCRMLTNLDHRGLKCREIPCAQTGSLLLVVGDVLKMFRPSRIAEEIAHLSNACASRRTSSAEMRLLTPRSISSARRAASCNQSWEISSSDKVSRLKRSCSANSARSLTVNNKASSRIISAFMGEIVALSQASFDVRITRFPGSGLPLLTTHEAGGQILYSPSYTVGRGKWET